MNVASLAAVSSLAHSLVQRPGAFLTVVSEAHARLFDGLGVDAAELYLADPAQDRLRLLAFFGQNKAPFAARQSFAFGEGLPGHAARDGRTVESKRSANDPRFLRPDVFAAGYEAVVAVPLPLPHGVLGVFCFATRDIARAEQAKGDTEQIAPLFAACLHSGLVSLGDKLKIELDAAGDAAFSAAEEGLFGAEGTVRPAKATNASCEGFSNCPVLTGAVCGAGACSFQEKTKANLCLPLFVGEEVAAVHSLGAKDPEQGAAPWLWMTRHSLGNWLAEGDAKPWLEISAFGRFDVRRNGVHLEPKDFKRRQAYVLLKLLVAQAGRAVSTDELCLALWPNEDPTDTIQRLHVTLNALRSTIEPEPHAQQVIVRDGASYAFAPTVPCFVDVQAFFAQAKLAFSQDGKSALAAATTALDLYKGPLLAEERYAGFAEIEREHCHETAVRLFMRMAELQRQSGDLGGQIATYLRLIALDECQFAAQEALVEALYAAGRLSEADMWRARLARLLQDDAPPSEGAVPLSECRR